MQSGEDGSVLIWVPRAQGCVFFGRARFVKDYQIFIYCSQGVFFPLLLSHLLNDFLHVLSDGIICCVLDCLFKQLGWIALNHIFGLDVYFWFGLLLVCYFDSSSWCLVLFCLIDVAISEFLLVVVEDRWPMYLLGIYSDCAPDGHKLYCIVTGEFLLALMRKGLVGLCFAIYQSKLCKVMMFNGNFLMMIISCYWIDDHIAIISMSSVSYWPGWNFLGSETKGSCVPGWAVQLSVAPCKGEQPWKRAPRCYFLWSMWSLLICIFTETHLQSIKSVYLCSLVEFVEVWIFLQLGSDVFLKQVLNEGCYFGFVYLNRSVHGLMLEKLAIILFCMLCWGGISCWLFLLPTPTVREGFPSGLSFLGFVLWWLFMIVPAASFAVKNRLGAQLNLFGWLNCRLHLAFE